MVQVGHSIEDPFNVHMYLPGSGQEDVLIIEGPRVLNLLALLALLVQKSTDADTAHTQANLREDALDRNPGPQTRVNPKPRYAGDELDFDVTEWHDEWKRDTLAGRSLRPQALEA